MKYMIHTMPARYWYVTDHLIPSMLQQGIKFSDIDVYLDTNGDGCLRSTLKSFKQLPKDGYTWHLQDDVILASNFHETIFENYDLPFPVYRVVCGFASVYDEGEPGKVHPKDMWYSFPCIMISNKLAHEFVDFVVNDIDENDCIRIANNMFDDWLFKQFMFKKHPEEEILNVAPNLVNNIDYLIGGSTISKREEKIESLYWDESKLIEELKEKMS